MQKNKTKVKAENYLVIQGWMVSDLKLKGNELLIYAIIYGFSQEEGQRFTGSLQYLADWTNTSKETTRQCLKSLVEKELLIKEEEYINNVKFCRYYTRNLEGVYKKLGGGIQETCINNIEYNKEYNINNNNKEEVETSKKDTLYDYLQNNGFVLAPIHYEEVSTWEDTELTRYAIKQAVLKNIYTIKYISAILNSYKQNNIRTVQQAQEHEARRGKSFDQPKKKDYRDVLDEWLAEKQAEDERRLTDDLSRSD